MQKRGKTRGRGDRGFTLTEAAIVIGIVGIVLGAVWIGANAVYSAMRVSSTSREIVSILQKTRAIHGTQSSVDPALSALSLAYAGVIPSDMIVTDASGNIVAVQDVWGGALTMAAQSVDSTNDAFSISLATVPTSACIDLFVRTTGNSRDSGLVGADNAPSAGTPFPLTLTSAAALCGNTDVSGNNVVFTFKLRS